MRKDQFRRVENRWGRRDLFSHRRPRRRVPWSVILVVLALAAGAYALTRADLGSLLTSLQSLLPGSTDAQSEAPRSDPDSLPLLPLPPAPPG
ncbi:MAG: hypothetical protein WAM94_12305 [Chromatiaceae bacterium]